jgi:polyphosphate kinase 2 (PPK2 family)
MIGLFNRSHYEDVLVPRVQKWVEGQVIKDRYGTSTTSSNCWPTARPRW